MIPEFIDSSNNNVNEISSVDPPTIFFNINEKIEIKSQVEVSGTENLGLRVRKSPGTEHPILFKASEGDIFNVIDGPVIVTDQTWWKIQAVQDSAKVGWSVQEFLSLKIK